ncbi:MAG: hypothetical protein PWP55_611, partial [Clostridiales bacterium]|nr:hypothetical protein [Clostridiales bacterium]
MDPLLKFLQTVFTIKLYTFYNFYAIEKEKAKASPFLN